MVDRGSTHYRHDGIEYVDGVQNLSAVVTREYSDWSVLPLLTPPAVIQLKVERYQEAIHISYLNEDNQYKMMRLAYFPAQAVQVGIMCASPEGNGFQVTFEDYQLKKLP